ncbi:Uncharacterized conserved protein [Butyrivibrio fibrisolvens 16/4]|nr:Uncharacterized conserved protein [Butyrivibrio fibrisolvens 16/4]
MNICILGWYGTETMGDRAILDGIIKIFERKEQGNTYYLGSLVPFFSERTIYYDYDCYTDGKRINIEIFCEKNIQDLKRYILKSDYVIMGGGPIMDISEILIIRRAFSIAKKNKIKTGLIGCGYGPFHSAFFKSISEEIIKLSDIVILRDKLSSQRAQVVKNSSEIVTLSDPAVISALAYKESNKRIESDYVVLNFRDTRFNVYKDNILDVMQDLYRLTSQIAKEYSKVIMVPMHTFFWGGDDRSYFAEMFLGRNIKNVCIQYEPQSLYELYATFANAKACVGMRYHSIILQTILNGNNLILDYTESKIGKISGFFGRGR